MNSQWIYFILLCGAVTESTNTGCIAAGERNITCTFRENVNSTQKDFGVYFYPDSGGDEPLLDCGWIKQSLHCIQQEGFQIMKPVSDRVVLIVPLMFIKRLGIFRCVIQVFMHNEGKPCRFLEQKDEQVTACEAEAASDENQVTLKCNFSFHVENFSILRKKTVVASFTRSYCQSSSLCRYTLNHNRSIFTVKLDVSKQHPDDEYYCHPDNSSRQFKVQGCMPTHAIHNEGPCVPVIATILGLAGVLVLVLILVLVTAFLRSQTKNLPSLCTTFAIRKRRWVDGLAGWCRQDTVSNDHQLHTRDTECKGQLDVIAKNV